MVDILETAHLLAYFLQLNFYEQNSPLLQGDPCLEISGSWERRDLERGVLCD